MAESQKPGSYRARRRAEAELREAEWRRIIEEQAKSGLSQAEFCSSRSIDKSKFYWWKSELRRRDRKAEAAISESTPTPKQPARNALVPVRVAPKKKEPPVFYELVLSGRRTLRVPADFDPTSLARLLRFLEEVE